MRPWEETWSCGDHHIFNNKAAQWVHAIEQANCPHGGVCTVTSVEREMTDGCDDGADILGRAHLIAAAPELYRALNALVRWRTKESCVDDCPGHLLTAADAALKKARGE